MEDLVEKIRCALANSASTDDRRSGAAACRLVLAALEAEQGSPMTLPGEASRAPTIANIQPDQFFDLLIAKLKTMVDAKGAAPAPATRNAVGPLRIPMIVLPPAK